MSVSQEKRAKASFWSRRFALMFNNHTNPPREKKRYEIHLVQGILNEPDLSVSKG